MDDRPHSGPWAYPPRRRRSSAARDQIVAVLVAAIVLVVAVCAANKALPQAAYDATNFEAIQ